MAYENMSDLQLVEYIQSKNAYNKLLVVIGFVTIPIGIGFIIIGYAFFRLFQSIKAQRALSKRQSQSSTDTMVQCSSCKGWSDPESKFCNHCGEGLQIANVEV